MFSNDELTKYIEFSRFVTKYANWSLSTAEVMKLNQLFANYEAVRKKIEASTIEVKQVVDLEEGKTVADKKKTKTKK